MVVKEESLNFVEGESSNGHAERFRDTQQDIDGEVAMPGAGFARPTLLLLPGDRDVAEAELTKAPGAREDQVKMEMPLHMAEWTLMPSNQQTTFWKVLWEDGENVDSL
ncbi:hypothetical protein lerEdw1_013498, partial [Lerista edwardsae]